MPMPPPGPKPQCLLQRPGLSARPTRAARPGLPRHDYPSDAVVASMSRRERIALLESEDGEGNAAARPRSPPTAAAPAPIPVALPPIQRAVEQRPVGRKGRDEDELPNSQMTRTHEPRRRPRRSGAASQDEGADDDEWERRRQKRKMRLQQHKVGPRSARGPREDPFADAPQPAAPRVAARGASKGAGSAARATSVGAGGEPEVMSSLAMPVAVTPAAPSAASSSGQALLQELDDVARTGFEHPRWCALCAGVKASAHKLNTGNLLRAVESLAGVSFGTSEPAEPVASAYQEAAEALLACVAPQLGSLNVAAVVDSLRLMAAARVAEQTYLDMLLSQLIVLMRREKAVPVVTLVTIARAVGDLHASGTSAKKAASGAGSAANKRCVDTVSEEIVKALDELREEQLARIGGSFVVAFMDDTQRRTLLRRTAELEVGLRLTSSERLGAMKEIERAVRQHSFAFVASLPDQTKDYLMRLKAAE